MSHNSGVQTEDKEKKANSKARLAVDKSSGSLGYSIYDACLSNNIKRLKAIILDSELDLRELIYFPHDGKMSPLTFAVKSCNFEAVECLTAFGTNLDDIYVPGSTILHIACQQAHFSQQENLNIVKHLVDKGADLKSLDDGKKTCLMVAVRKDDVCEYLLSKGVLDVNAQDKDGQTALHHAVSLSCIASAKILLAFGADVNIKDDDDVDAFRLSAVCNEQEIMEYFIEKTDVPQSSVIDGFYLLTANFLLKNDMDSAVKTFIKALSLKKHEDRTHSEESMSILKSIFPFQTEPKTPEELLHNSEDKETRLIRAFLIYQRILGGHHQISVTCSMFLYRLFMDGKNKLKAGEILYYVYSEVMNKKPPFFDRCLLIYRELIKHMFSLSCDEIKPENVFALFKMLVNHLEKAHTCLRRWSSDELRNFDKLIVDTVGVLITCSNIITDGETREEFNSEIQKLVKLNPRGLNDVTLLHTLLNYDWKSLGFTMAEPQDTTTLIKILLEFGASVNSTDDKRNTPLHTVLMCHGFTFVDRLPDQDDVVELLVQRGTHMDAFNSRNQTVLSLMKAAGHHVCDVQYQTLQCLAATTIMKNAIPFEGTVSKSIVPFVKMHGKPHITGSRYWAGF